MELTFDLHASIHFLNSVEQPLNSLVVKAVGSQQRPFQLKQLMINLLPNIFILYCLKTENINEHQAQIFCNYNYSLLVASRFLHSQNWLDLPSSVAEYWEKIRSKLCVCGGKGRCKEVKSFHEVKALVDAEINDAKLPIS